MKSTGIVRKVDELGRIVLPIELRRTLDIAERDELEIKWFLRSMSLPAFSAVLPAVLSATMAEMSAWSALRT